MPDSRATTKSTKFVETPDSRATTKSTKSTTKNSIGSQGTSTSEGTNPERRASVENQPLPGLEVSRIKRADKQREATIQKKHTDFEQCVLQEELTLGIAESKRSLHHQEEPKRSSLDRCKEFLRKFEQGCRLDALMGCVILVNSAFIGIETDAQLYNLDPANDLRFVVMEHVFLVIYVCELWLHIWVSGVQYCSTGWGAFDTFIVGMGCLTTWVIAPMGSSFAAVRQVSDKILIGRVCRLLKLARAIRMMSRFKILWSMVRGLFGAIGVLLWTLVLVTALLFLFAVLGVELLGREEVWIDPQREGDEQWEFVTELALNQFGTMFWAMLTLLQFLTLDSWTGIVEPIVYERPFLMMYFLTVLLVLAIALMNLVTAAIVEDALQAAAGDKETEKRFLAKQRAAVRDKLEEQFLEGDADGDGVLTKEELQDYFSASEAIQTQLEVFGSLSDILQLYDIIDTEDCGALKIEKLLDGLCKYKDDKHGFLLQTVHDQLMEETHAAMKANLPKGPGRRSSISRTTSARPPGSQASVSLNAPALVLPEPEKGGSAHAQNNGGSLANLEPPLKVPAALPSDEILELQDWLLDLEKQVDSKVESIMELAGVIGVKVKEALAELRSPPPAGKATEDLMADGAISQAMPIQLAPR